MQWKDLTGIIGKAAPLLGTVLGGPAGGAIGGVISAALGTDNNPEAIAKAIESDPEAYAKLKQIEMDHKAELEKAAINAGVEHRRIDTADIQSARQRDVQMQQSGYHNYRADFMLFLAFASLIGICYMINTNDSLKPQVLAVFNMAIGALLKMLGDGFQFEFGSSRGSKEKDLR